MSNEVIIQKDKYLTTANYLTGNTDQVPVTKDLNNQHIGIHTINERYRSNFYDKSSSFVATPVMIRKDNGFTTTNTLTMQQSRELQVAFHWQTPMSTTYPWNNSEGRVSLYEKFPKEASRLG